MMLDLGHWMLGAYGVIITFLALYFCVRWRKECDKTQTYLDITDRRATRRLAAHRKLRDAIIAALDDDQRQRGDFL